MNVESARSFAIEWIDAWNSHDLDRVMSHYSEEVKFVSPFIVTVFGEPSGTITGKAALRAYFQKALIAYPDLRFDLFEILVGVASVTLYYRSVKNLLTAEVMLMEDDGLVTGVLAHYSEGRD